MSANFRFRPVATAWHIYIDSEEAERTALDLFELSQIRIDISYRSSQNAGAQ